MKSSIILAFIVSLTSSHMLTCAERNISTVTTNTKHIETDSNNDVTEDIELLEENDDDVEYEKQFDNMLCLNASCLSIFIPTFDKTK